MKTACLLSLMLAACTATRTTPFFREIAQDATATVERAGGERTWRCRVPGIPDTYWLPKVQVLSFESPGAMSVDEERALFQNLDADLSERVPVVTSRRETASPRELYYVYESRRRVGHLSVSGHRLENSFELIMVVCEMGADR